MYYISSIHTVSSYSEWQEKSVQFWHESSCILGVPMHGRSCTKEDSTSNLYHMFSKGHDHMYFNRNLNCLKLQGTWSRVFQQKPELPKTPRDMITCITTETWIASIKLQASLSSPFLLPLPDLVMPWQGHYPVPWASVHVRNKNSAISTVCDFLNQSVFHLLAPVNSLSELCVHHSFKWSVNWWLEICLFSQAGFEPATFRLWVWCS